jgi:hypothetical protein
MIPESRYLRADQGDARDDRDVLPGFAVLKTYVFFLEKKCFSPNFSESPDHANHPLHASGTGGF